jgi:phenylacetate-CoA ligase
MRRQRLARLLRVAHARSPVYARLWKAAGCQPADARMADEPEAVLQALPAVDKRLLMAQFDDWATDRAITWQAWQRHLEAASLGGVEADVAEPWLGRYTAWTSSGTSGHPGVFVQDAHSLAVYDALDAWRLRAAAPTSAFGPGAGWMPSWLPGWSSGRRFVYLAAIGGRYAGHVGMRRVQRLSESFAATGWAGAWWRPPEIEFLSVLQPMDDILDALEAIRPDVLITYPSAADTLAMCSEWRRWRPQEVWVGGEQLSHAQRAQITARWGCTLRNCYGASEFPNIAFECGHGNLHLNDEWLILEPVDEHDRPVARGTESCTTLLTNLANLSQPLIRYRLHDRICLRPEPCPCGNPAPVITVQGRADQVLRLPGLTSKETVTVLPLALETLIEEAGGPAEFQVVHRGGSHLELRLGQASIGRACEAAKLQCVLKDWLVEHGVNRPRVSLSRVAPSAESGSGKLQHVLRQPG